MMFARANFRAAYSLCTIGIPPGGEVRLFAEGVFQYTTGGSPLSASVRASVQTPPIGRPPGKGICPAEAAVPSSPFGMLGFAAFYLGSYCPRPRRAGDSRSRGQ